jgi:hypothetical protein
MMRILVMAIAAWVLVGGIAYAIYSHFDDTDALMEQVLRLPVQERADFISANLTPELLRYMAIRPCGDSP